MSTWTKEFLLEFIELFKIEECLWKTTSKYYYNKVERERSYDLLLEKVKNVDPDANRNTVICKIRNLRSAFRKAARKIVKSANAGMGNDEEVRGSPTKPWYYDKLLFLIDQQTSMVSECSIGSNNIGDSVVGNSTSVSSSIIGSVDSSSEESNDDFEAPLTPSSNRSPSSDVTAVRNRFKRQKKIGDQQKKLPNAVVGEKVAAVMHEDQFDIFGKNIAEKLRQLDNEQRIYVQAIIHDALFASEFSTSQQDALIKLECPQPSVQQQYVGQSEMNQNVNQNAEVPNDNFFSAF